MQFGFLGSVAVGPDESLYFTDSGTSVWRITPTGTLEHVAGGVVKPPSTAELPADAPGRDAWLSAQGIDVGPDGSVYVAGRTTIRRIDPLGYVTTIAGSPTRGDEGDGGPALGAKFLDASDVSLGPDGSLFVVDTFRIRRISPQGVIDTVVGSRGDGEPFPDGILGTEALLSPNSVEARDDGIVLFGYFAYVWETDGFRRAQNQLSYLGYLDGDRVFTATVRGQRVQGNNVYAIAAAVAPDGEIVSTSGKEHITLASPLAIPSLVSASGDERYNFDLFRRHNETIDAMTGSSIFSFAYDETGRLTAITDADGDTTAIERDENGFPVLITGPYGHQTQLVNNESGLISAITNPNGETYSFTYHDARGLLASMSDPRGSTSYFEYDDLGRLTRDTDSAGGERVLVRSELENGYEVEFSSPEGVKTNYIMRALPDGSREKTVQSPDGTRTSVIEKPNSIREMTYADGTVATLELQPDPRFGMKAPLTKRIEVTTPGGLTSITTAKREVKLNEKQELLQQTDTLSSNGNERRHIYDRVSRTLTTVSPEGRQTTTRLDEQGRTIRVEVPGYFPVEYHYDARGRLSSTSQGDRVSNVVYDARGEIQATRDALGREETFEYDLASQLLKNVLADGRAVNYQYDPAGNLTSLKPPDRPEHTFTYDSRGLSESYVMPEIGDGAGRVEFSYNLDAQLTRLRLPDLSEVENHYDATGRLTAVVQPEGRTTFAYDPATGKLSRWSDSTRVDLSYTYDGPLLTDVAWSGEVEGSVHRTFTHNLSLASLSVDGGQNIAYTYDRDGLLVSAGTLEVERDPTNGLIVGSTVGTLHTSQSTTQYGEPASMTVRFGQGQVYGYILDRDLAGQIVSKEEFVQGEAERTEYTYTVTGQLETVRKAGVVQVEYAYDANGNRTLERRPLSDEIVSAAYDARDRMTRYGTKTYSYSSTGFLTKRIDSISQTSSEYTYNTAGDLTQVRLPDQEEVRYVIDAAHRRVGRHAPGEPFKAWLYGDQLNPIAELDADGTVVSQFVYATQRNAPDYMLHRGTLYRFVNDVRGSVRLVVNTQTGEVVQSLRYSPFGQVEQDTNPGFQPFGFAGGLYDSQTGLVRFGARDYDPEVGRWTAMDPLGFSAGDTSLYVYVFNDPINLIDPTGELVFLPVVAALALADAALSAADAISLAADLADPCLSSASKAASLALFLAGLALPGAGFSAAKRLRRLGKACFVAGTLIVTPDGQTPIEQISIGDTVWARNDQTGEHAWKTVTATMSAPSNKIVELTLTLPNGTPEILTVTESHEFWTEHRWQPAHTLDPGLSVWTLSGWARVESVASTHAPREVYNFEVEDFHTYFAGDAAVWTHNTCVRKARNAGQWVEAGARGREIAGKIKQRVRKELRGAAGRGKHQGQHGKWQKKAAGEIEAEAKKMKEAGVLPEVTGPLEAEARRLLNQASAIDHR